MTEEATEPDGRRNIRRLALRSVLLQGAFNYERFQNLGLWWTLRPFLDRMYRDRDERAAAYKRHLAYFNTHPWIVGPILGIVVGMERRRAQGAEGLDDEAINSVKVGMMAPLAGIGDSLLFGTIRPILGGVCATLAVSGNIAGPIIFFVALLALQIVARFYGTSLGYRQGTRFFERLDTAAVDQVKAGATMVGLAVTGALVATLLTVSTPLAYHKGHQTLKLQDSLDQVLPGMLPLAAALLVFWLVRRRVSAVVILLGITVVGLVGGYFGILA
ncbi:PTS system mannose/fructose/sorbose family transporter subunit IID [Streptomyces sp. TS71-3]|uniref:PTS system mannose/fructose/sorbose family transporter subunit IID n=1 Tax=Streptomyces sp. TS71-3 TaxID=2733862 RepID=UPI001BB3B806|nr:PTS system mannose/fructose/sorbose family transporter subunit IID [Streptomyces sp. TS71-3]